MSSTLSLEWKIHEHFSTLTENRSQKKNKNCGIEDVIWSELFYYYCWLSVE